MATRPVNHGGAHAKAVGSGDGGGGGEHAQDLEEREEAQGEAISFNAAICCLRGRAFEALENLPRACACFTAAVRCDPFCYEAFQVPGGWSSPEKPPEGILTPQACCHAPMCGGTLAAVSVLRRHGTCRSVWGNASCEQRRALGKGLWR